MLKKKLLGQPLVGRRVEVIDSADLDDISKFGTRTASLTERLVWKVCDWSVLPSRWRRLLRKRFARNFKGPFDVTCLDMNFRLYPAENYCDRILFGRKDLPEKAEHLVLLQYIQPGMVFVDIGANVGSYSIFVGRNVALDVEIVAFEPHPRTFKKLLFNMKANGLSTNNVINAGVGPVTTTMDLWSDGGSNIGHTSMLKAGTSNAKISHKVNVLRLVDVLDERGIARIDVLKIDIEGFEDRALAPFLENAAHELLPKVILIEIAHSHLWERDLFLIMQKRGYELAFKTEENRLLVKS